MPDLIVGPKPALGADETATFHEFNRAMWREAARQQSALRARLEERIARAEVRNRDLRDRDASVS